MVPLDIASEVSLGVVISSSLELFSSSFEPAGGDLVGSGGVFLVTTGLDKNLHEGRVEGRQCGGGMDLGEGTGVEAGATEGGGGTCGTTTWAAGRGGVGGSGVEEPEG